MTKISSKTFYFLFLLVIFTTPTLAAKYHRPETEAEKALDKILLESGKKETSLFRFIFEGAGEKEKFSSLFSNKLLTSWRKAEADAVKRNCDGKYLSGESCGLDYNVITCAQDFPESFLYISKNIRKNEVLITSVWPHNASKEYQNQYRLIKSETGSWKLDGVSCGVGGRFNVNEAQYHPPGTTAEKALDEILRLYNKDTDIDGFIFNPPWYKHTNDKKYTALFTNAFLSTAERDRKAAITKSCNGKYPKNGLECDMLEGSNPILCAQDYAPDILFRTLSSSKNEAVISYSYSPSSGKPTLSLYKFLKQKGTWKLDGINCGDGLNRINMP